jgi:hypothetical protein
MALLKKNHYGASLEFQTTNPTHHSPIHETVSSSLAIFDGFPANTEV